MTGSPARNRVRSWGRRLAYSFFSSIGTLLSHRLGTLMTVLVLGIAMLLPLGLYLTVENLRAIDLQQGEWGTITVFLDPAVDAVGATAIADRIQSEHGARAEAISPDQGMAEFREASGFGGAAELFEENPLPWVLQVTPASAEGVSAEVAVATLGEWLPSLDGVDFVQVDYKWLQRLGRLLALGNAFVSVLAALFSLAVIVVIANTIRLDVASRAEEIQVLHLVGASDGFIRQPFLYSGFWYGLLGAVLALLLLSGCLYYLAGPLEDLLDAYGNSFRLRGLGISSALGVILAGGLLGLLGAWVSVHRYLRQFRLENPRVR